MGNYFTSWVLAIEEVLFSGISHMYNFLFILFQMLWVIAGSWKGYESSPTEWERAHFVVVKNLGNHITVSGHREMSLWSENTYKPEVWVWS
jgi:hypothetical protein